MLELTNRFWIILSFLVLWAVLTILTVTWGTRFDWPDYVHIDYGLPIVWGTQTLSTIVGPVNLWSVDVTALMLDLGFWMVLMVLAVSAMLYFFNRKVLYGKKE